MKTSLLTLLTLVYTASAGQVLLNSTNNPVTSTGNVSYASAWGDYDNDGDIDLYVCNYLRTNYLFQNNGNGTFSKITSGPLVTSSLGHWSSSWVDFDDDGDLDLYVVNSYTDNNELFRNNGGGSFTNISSTITSTSDQLTNNAAWADTDNDGDLDLLLANGSNSSAQTRNQNNGYYINNGNGTFTRNTTSIIATDGGFSEFGNFGDYDADGDPDLIVINTFQDNFFYENIGGGAFAKVQNQPFLSTGEQPLTACWGDFNNDRLLDLVVGSYSSSRVYYNNGDRTFHVGTLPDISGNALGVSLADLNHDGRLDILIICTGQPALYYLNNGDETFTKTNAGDITSVATDFANGGAVGDFDKDGDLDVFVANDDRKNLLFKNTEVEGNWLSVKLAGNTSNSQGVGAKVQVRTDGQWQMREVSVLSGYRTQNSIEAHFGLGEHAKVDLLRVEWPSGNVQLIQDVTANQFITITEENSLNVDHTFSLTLETQEDHSVDFVRSEFQNAFADGEGDRLKSLKLTAVPAHGQLLLDGEEVVIGQEVSQFDIARLTFAPAADFYGNTIVALDVIDYRNRAVASELAIDVLPVNDPPVISAIADVDREVLGTFGFFTVDFTVNDVDDDLAGLILSASSNDEAVIEAGNISFVGVGATRVLKATANKDGSSVIMVKASDGELSAEQTFTVKVHVLIVGVEEAANVVKSYPNPVKDILYLETGRSDVRPADWALVDVRGNPVVVQEASVGMNGVVSLNVSTLPAGMYMLRTAPGGKSARSLKFCKQ